MFSQNNNLLAGDNEIVVQTWGFDENEQVKFTLTTIGEAYYYGDRDCEYVIETMSPAVHTINGQYTDFNYYYTIQHDNEVPNENYYFILGLLELEVVWLDYPNEKKYFYYDVRDVQYYGACDYHSKDIFIRVTKNNPNLNIFLYKGNRVPSQEESPIGSNNWENVDGATKTFWDIRGITHRPLPPTVPEGFDVTGNIGEHPRLSWLLNSNQVIDEYNIYRSENGNDYNLIASVNKNTNHYIDNEIIIGNKKNDPTVCYKITAVGPEFESYPTLPKCKKFDGINKYLNSKHTFYDIKNDTLYNAYPNPFNPETKIKFDLSKRGNVNITIYNILGVKIKTLLNTFLEKGSYNISFDGKDLPSGTYIYRMVTDNVVITKSIILLK